MYIIVIKRICTYVLAYTYIYTCLSAGNTLARVLP